MYGVCGMCGTLGHPDLERSTGWFLVGWSVEAGGWSAGWSEVSEDETFGGDAEKGGGDAERLSQER